MGCSCAVRQQASFWYVAITLWSLLVLPQPLSADDAIGHSGEADRTARYEKRIADLEEQVRRLKAARFEPTNITLPGDISGSWEFCRPSWLRLGMDRVPSDLPVPVPAGCDGKSEREQGRAPSFEELYAALFDQSWNPLSNIFTEFRATGSMAVDLTYPHSALRRPGGEARFGSVLERLPVRGGVRMPRFVVEVGTFHGGSAAFMAEFFSRRGARSIPILCVDPFVGDLNMWLNKHSWSHLALTGGRPTLYEQFMANIAGLHALGVSQTHVLPFPVTSIIAARWLQLRGFTPDLIFLDSAHEVDETYMELVLYWRILQPGGVLFGDDYRWPSVKVDVDRFVRNYRLVMDALDEDIWCITKPGLELAALGHQ